MAKAKQKLVKIRFRKRGLNGRRKVTRKAKRH